MLHVLYTIILFLEKKEATAFRKFPGEFLRPRITVHANRVVPSLTPYDLSFPQKRGFHMPPRYANGHISATGDPIHFMFGSRVGFSGTPDRTALFTVGKISNGHISATGRPIHFVFGYRVGFSGTADLTALFSIRTNSR